MRTVSLRITIGALLLLSAAGVRPASSATIEKPGFTLAMPAGWREMPPEVLQTFHDNAVKRAPGSRVPRYDYGFQLEASEYWLAYPYILIRLDDSGRIPEPDLRAMPRIDLRTKGIDLRAPSAQMQYDDEAHLVWMRLDATVPEFGTIRGLAGMIPTEQGWVHVNGYARAEDFDRYVDVIRGVARSVRVAPHLAYRPHWSDNTGPFRRIDSGNFWVQFTVVLAIVAGLGTLLTRAALNHRA